MQNYARKNNYIIGKKEMRKKKYDIKFNVLNEKRAHTSPKINVWFIYLLQTSIHAVTEHKNESAHLRINKEKRI